MTTHVTDPPLEAGLPAVSGSASSKSGAHAHDHAMTSAFVDDLPASENARTTSAAGATRVPRSLSLRETSAWAGLFAIGVAAVLVFWWFDALPFQDLPAHAGLIAMRHRFASGALESGFESQYFVLAPHIGPYSVFRFFGELFVRVLGPVGAVRALATLPLIATPAALMIARRRLQGDSSPLYGYLGVTLSFGFMTLLGFASYLLGLAVMLVGLVMWLELLVAADDASPSIPRRELAMAAFAPLIFVAHGHAFALFLLCAAVSASCTGFQWTRLVRGRALIPALGLAGYVAWLERGATTPPGSVPVVPPLVPVFHGPSSKLELLVTPTLMTRSGVDFLVAIAIWGFAIACTVVMVRWLVVARPDTRSSSRAALLSSVGKANLDASGRHSRALYACAAALAALFLALPHTVGWFGFVDGRVLPLVLMLALLGVRYEALPKWLARAGSVGIPASAVVVSVVALVASHFFQIEAHGYREVLAKVPAESTLLNLPLDPNSDVFTAHPFIHYDKLALAERPVVVSDVWFHQGSALYPTAANPALRLPESYSESDLKLIDWPAYHLEDWEYVLIRTRPAAAQPFTPEDLVLDEHIGGWWLFKRASNAARL